jgi:transposase
MITLTADERTQLDDLLHCGASKARVLTRARILLKSADGWTIERIAQALDVCPATVSNTRQRYQQGGVQRVLTDLPPKPHERALDAEGEAVLIATACSAVPEGHDHWTLRMLRGRLIELGVVEGISAATVQATLKKMRSNPGGVSTGASPSSMRHS